MSDGTLFIVGFGGDPNTGKTSIITKIKDEMIGLDGISPTYVVGQVDYPIVLDGRPFVIRLRDVPGKPVLESMTDSAYRDVNLVVLVYSIVDRSTFESISKWHAKVTNVAKYEPKIIIAANKYDLDDQRSVSAAEGAALVNGDIIACYEVSALTGHDIDQLKEAIEAQAVLLKTRPLTPPPPPPEDGPSCC